MGYTDERIQCNFVLSESDNRRLKALAEANGTSRALYARKIVVAFVNRHIDPSLEMARSPEFPPAQSPAFIPAYEPPQPKLPEYLSNVRQDGTVIRNPHHATVGPTDRHGNPVPAPRYEPPSGGSILGASIVGHGSIVQR